MNIKYLTSIILTSIVLLGTAAYILRLTFNGQLTPTAQFTDSIMMIGIGLSALLTITWYFTSIGWYKLSKPKLTLSMVWLIIILCGAYLIMDPATNMTYASDIMRISWVYVVIAALTGFASADTGTNGWSVARRVKNAEVIEI